MLSTGGHVYSEIFIHLNWHCKNDHPFIGDALKNPLYRQIENYCEKTKGIKFFGVGGSADHIHLIIQMEPEVCLAEWVGKVKGSSSYEMNRQSNRKVLEWQRGYGAVSFAGRDMKSVQRYVAYQEEHHQAGSANRKLENSGQYQETVFEEEDHFGTDAFGLAAGERG